MILQHLLLSISQLLFSFLCMIFLPFFKKIAYLPHLQCNHHFNITLADPNTMSTVFSAFFLKTSSFCPPVCFFTNLLLIYEKPNRVAVVFLGSARHDRQSGHSNFSRKKRGVTHWTNRWVYNQCATRTVRKEKRTAFGNTEWDDDDIDDDAESWPPYNLSAL